MANIKEEVLSDFLQKNNEFYGMFVGWTQKDGLGISRIDDRWYQSEYYLITSDELIPIIEAKNAEIESLRQQLAKPAPEAQILIDAKRAIEHGEYMAKSAESLLNYLNEVSNEDEGTIEPDDRFGDYTQGIRLSVHEFRKRAERCYTKATPDNGVEK